MYSYKVLPVTGTVGAMAYANYYIGIGLFLVILGLISFRFIKLIKNEGE